ncbi:MAG: ZIP family metal transporter [Candidatus Micrarchaeota archaeon]
MGFTDLLLGATIAMFATALGALGVIFFRKAGCKFYPYILSACAGVMIYTSAEMANGSHALSGDLIAGFGLVCGLFAFFVIERILPHIHSMIRKKEIEKTRKKAVLLAGTITLHNIPEGFAIASAFAGSTPLGWLVTAAIAIQDIPEGFVISGPLACFGINTKKSVLWGVFSGFVEFMAAIFGYMFLSLATTTTPFALAFSAGAMTYVAFIELLKDAYQEKGLKIVMPAVLGAVCAMGLGIVLAL